MSSKLDESDIHLCTYIPGTGLYRMNFITVGIEGRVGGVQEILTLLGL